MSGDALNAYLGADGVTVTLVPLVRDEEQWDKTTTTTADAVPDHAYRCYNDDEVGVDIRDHYITENYPFQPESW